MFKTKQAKQKTVGDILFSQGKITEEDLKRFISESERQKASLETIIRAAGKVSPEDIAQARAKLLNVPYIDLREKKIDREALDVVPLRTARVYHFFVFEKKEKDLKVAMVDPEDFKALEALEFLTKRENYKFKIYLVSLESFDSALRQYETLGVEVKKALEKAELPFVEEELTEEEVEKVVQEAPISQAVEVILRHAVEERASDVHIEPLENEIRVRYRIDGILHNSLTLPKKVLPAIIARIKVLANLKIDETRVPQDGRFFSRINDREIDFRVSTLPLSTGEKVVIRILDKGRGAMALENLGLSKDNIAILEKRIKEPYGMIIVCGPTGSGKSTTLYSILEILNKIGVNIVTLEDPVEYYIEGVNQSQIRPEVEFTFATGLRSILRQDPDIIMVGEIRDPETAEMAVHAALTGHLMFSTLHTNDAIGAIPRLIDMGVEPFLLTASLSMVIAQRLVRRICQKCRHEVQLPQGEYEAILSELEKLPPLIKQRVDFKNLKFYKGKGCESCNQEGYKGRIGIFEVLDITERIKDLITKEASQDEIFSCAREEKLMLTMREDGLLKALEGITTVEEVLRVT